MGKTGYDRLQCKGGETDKIDAEDHLSKLGAKLIVKNALNALEKGMNSVEKNGQKRKNSSIAMAVQEQIVGIATVIVMNLIAAP